MAPRYGSAGARTERVTFVREAATRRPGGGHAVSESVLGSAWASVNWVRGGESDRQGAVRELLVYRFSVLNEAIDALGLTTKDHIDWNGTRFNIREQPRRLAHTPEVEIIAEYTDQGGAV